LVFENKDINTVFIATRHDSHAQYTIKGIENGKAVFTEKPLALNIEELQEIINVYEKSSKPSLMVGFNRRFSEAAIKVKDYYRNTNDALIMNFRINAGYIPIDHWTQTSAGGGRIIGEMCHFIDLMQFITGSYPIQVYASGINTSNSKIMNSDNISVTIKFNNGSCGNILYTSMGGKAMPKEYLEIFGGGSTYVIDDFKKVILYTEGSKKIFKTVGKGHKQEVESFFNALKEGRSMPISFESICLTTITTFMINESLNTGLPQIIELPFNTTVK